MRVCDEPTRLYKNIKYICKINGVRLSDIEEPREAGTISRFEKRGNTMNLPVWILYNVYRKTGVTIEDLIEKDLTADRKIENSSEKPNKSTISKMEQVDEPKTQMKTQNSNLTFEKADEPQTDCKTCKHSSKEEESDECYLCSMYYNDNYEPQTFVADGMLFAKVDEPQTDCPWK